MPVGPLEIQAAIAKLSIDTELLHDVVHGGPTDTVATEGGVVPSVAKALAQIAAQIVAGYSAGYVVFALNNAARLSMTPAQHGQLLIQRNRDVAVTVGATTFPVGTDKYDLYYAPTTVTGSWVFHPIQLAASNADSAVASLAVLTSGLAGKMDIASYVGGFAAGVVRNADRLKTITDFNTANPNAALHFLGAENGTTAMYPLLSNNRAVDIVDGKNFHAAVANTARRCLGIGINFAMVNVPRRLVSWGAQGATGAGTLGSGMTAIQSFHARPTVARQQPARNLPGFDPAALNTANGQIVQVTSQGAVTVARTQSGIVLVAGAKTQGVKPIFGSGVDENQAVLMPIYFNSGDVNMPIRLMDIQDSTTLKHSTGVFVDETENVWLLTTNPKNAGYGNSLTGIQNIPVKLNAGYPVWDGKIVKKVRCDCSGNIFVLFTDGQLYAGGGANNTGQLGTGATANILNPLQIATGVSEFDVSGQETDATLALYILQGTTLKGAGYNVNGQMGQTGITSNRTSFVTISEEINMVRLGGTDTVSLFMRNTAGTWFGTGNNIHGLFGQGTMIATNSTPVLLSNLTLLIEAHGALVDLIVSGINGKHSACAVMTDGSAWTAGNNTNGCLGNGTIINSAQWTEVLWSRRDPTEKIVDCSSAVGPSTGPAFTWMTNHGRILAAGSAKYGFATGVAPPDTAGYDVLIASPVQMGTL